MRIDCYMSERCGSEAALKENIKKALGFEGLEAEVSFSRVTDVEAAERGLRGSPSVFVDGEEVQPADIAGFY